MRHVIALVALSLAAADPSHAASEWDRELYDPGAVRLDLPEPDLVLPMPCGGAMAFQRVTVAVDAGDPLADRELRLGQAGTGAGYVDYLRRDFLRGAFTAEDEGGTAYYIGRYEVTRLQHAALTDPDCGLDPSAAGALPMTGLSWFDAVDLARVYTEWLRRHAPDALPQEDGRPGFLRLPTEVEWEFAARGGEAVDPLDFGAVRPPMDDDLAAHAHFGGDAPAPVGSRRPNPLLIFDMLGNGEELVLEPFRLNAVGHLHGQNGGVVTRGGSYGSTAADMRSSRRREWPPYDAGTGLAQSRDTFAARFVIAAQVMTREARVDAIGAAWRRTFEGGGAAADLPLVDLASLIEGERDPARRAVLEAMQLELSGAQDAAERAERERVAATLEMAVVLLDNIRLVDARIEGFETHLDFVADELEALTAEDVAGDPELVRQLIDDMTATRVDLEGRLPDLVSTRRDLLGSYRTALALLADVEEGALERDLAVLDEKLAGRGNATLMAAAEDLRGDLEAFRGSPDLDADALLRLVVEPPR